MKSLHHAPIIHAFNLAQKKICSTSKEPKSSCWMGDMTPPPTQHEVFWLRQGCIFWSSRKSPPPSTILPCFCGFFGDHLSFIMVFSFSSFSPFCLPFFLQILSLFFNLGKKSSPPSPWAGGGELPEYISLSRGNMRYLNRVNRYRGLTSSAEISDY